MTRRQPPSSWLGFPLAAQEFVEENNPATVRNLFPAYVPKSKLPQDLFRRHVPLFHIRQKEQQSKACKRNVNECLRGLRREPAPPVRPGKIVSEMCRLPLGSPQPT